MRCDRAARDLRDDLPDIAAPTLTIAGAADAGTPPECLAAIADAVRDGRAAVASPTPGCGTTVPLNMVSGKPGSWRTHFPSGRGNFSFRYDTAPYSIMFPTSGDNFDTTLDRWIA